jgi:hypothetical protein
MMEKCPCDECLVRPTCGNRLVRRGPQNRSIIKYLIVEYAEKCPYIQEYFGHHPDGRIIHCHKKINHMCKLFGATNGKYFVWSANSIGIYD